MWETLVAGGSNKLVARRVAMEKNLCFSNNVDANGANARMPDGHNYQDYNISDISFRSGDWLDYVKVVYTHRSTGKKLIQEFGNPNGGSIQSAPQNLLQNPIVKAAWNSNKGENVAVDSLMGVQWKQMNGEETSIGYNNDNIFTQKYIDDYGVWKGRVWLCGMDIHGEAGSRVWGIGPHWCYHEDYTVTAPSPPPPPPPCTSDQECQSRPGALRGDCCNSNRQCGFMMTDFGKFHHCE